MAAPTARGVGAFGSGTTSFTAAVPTGGSAPVAGDAMYIIMESTDSTTTAGTPNTPGGWSKLFENTIAAGSSTEPAVSTLTIFGKIAGAGEGNVTVDGVGNHCAGAMIVIAGHGLSVITDTVVGAATDHGTSTTNVLAPSITVTANSLIITAMGLGDDANDTTNVSGVTNANLASITERIDQTVSTGSGGGVGIYTSTCAGTTTGTTEWDHDTAASSQSLQLGIKPIPADFPLTLDPGSYTVTGIATTPLADRMANAGPGTYTISGVAANLDRGFFVDAGAGAYAISGDAGSLLVGWMLPADPGSYTISGVDGALDRGFVLVADSGVYVITGVDATLVQAASGFSLNAEAGGYSISGTDAAVLAQRLLSAESGVYLITGADAETTAGRVLAADPGAYVITGQAATFVVDRLLAANAGNYALAGAEAALRLSDVIMSANPGVYLITDAAARALLEVDMIAGGLTAEQNTWLDELHRLTGLRSGVPLTVTQTQRAAGAITQSISEVSGTVTVERQ